MKNLKDYSDNSYALQASMHLNDIIIEKYLSGTLPETRQISMKELSKYSAYYDYTKLRKYLGNNFYRVNGEDIKVIADNELLSEKAKLHCKRKILKLITPSKFEQYSFENCVEKFVTDIEFTEEERAFFNLMVNELLAIASIKECPHQISLGDLLMFNLLNFGSFYNNAKNVYNGILQKKLHTGDNIKIYLEQNLAEFEIDNIYKLAEKYDCFFNINGILKCDLEADRNILIKNFINSVIYDFNDLLSRIALLQKLNNKYPILIREKDNEEFN